MNGIVVARCAEWDPIEKTLFGCQCALLGTRS